MDSTAISSIGNLAILAAKGVVPEALAHRVTALPKDIALADLEKFQPGRSRFRGVFSTSSLDAFAAYVSGRAGAIAAPVFISDRGYQAIAIFNLGTEASPGHADDRATLELPRTAAMAAVLAAHGTRYTQKELIEFIEDWAPILTAYDADGEPAAMPRVLAAIREVTIAKASEATTKVTDFAERKSAFEDVEAKAAAGLPAGLILTCAPCLGLPSRAFRLRLGVLTSHDKPVLTLKIVGYESEMEAIIADFARVVTERLGTQAIPHLGSFVA